MIYYGIDPGKAGAVCRMAGNQLIFIDAEKLDLHALGKSLFHHKEIDGVFVMLEKVQVMPRFRKKRLPSGQVIEEQAGQGSVGMLNYGIGYGRYLGMLQALAIPFDEIHPATWKREFHLWGMKKEVSIERAIQLFPQAAPDLKRKKDHGRAEALLLAEYARRKNMGATGLLAEYTRFEKRRKSVEDERKEIVLP